MEIVDKITEICKRFFEQTPEAVDLLDNEQFSELFDLYVTWVSNIQNDWNKYSYYHYLAGVLSMSGVDYREKLTYLNKNVATGVFAANDSAFNMLKGTYSTLSELGTFIWTDSCEIKSEILRTTLDRIEIKKEKIDLDDKNIYNFLNNLDVKEVIIDQDTVFLKDGAVVSDTKDFNNIRLFRSSWIETIYFPDSIKKISPCKVAPLGKHDLKAAYVSEDVEIPVSAKDYLKNICHKR